MRRYILLFVLMASWDWITAASVRYIAAQNLAAIPLGSLLALFWWAAIVNLQRDWRTAAVICVAAAIGTGLGLYIP